MARLTLPSGRMVEYTRDNVRRVRGISTAVNGQKQAIVSEISYRADGMRTGYLYGNGLSGQRVYDRQGRLLRQDLGVRSAGTWSSKSWERHYQYDKNSNLVRRGPSPDESERNYGYDALDRLEDERKAGPPEERQIYEYDLNGNRLREREKQEIEHFLEKGSNRLLATEELLRTGEGEVEESSTSWRYEYNNAGRLKAVYQEGVKVSTYLYGADGLRRKKTVYETDGSTVAKEIHYHYVSGLLVSETTATGTLLRDYLWNPDGSPLAQIEGGTPGNSQERLLYLHTDHLLTPRRATNTAGTSVWSWESSAFGKESPKQDPDGDGTLTVVQLRYPGQYHDTETGLYYNWNRYYDPSTGRYIQSDPIGLRDGLNTYAYVGGNPLIYTDPPGLAACYIHYNWYPITMPFPIPFTDSNTLPLGHAGVLSWNNSTGSTRYYEYGRYGTIFGRVKRTKIPDLDIGKDGNPTPESWKKLLDHLSEKLGKGKNISYECDKDADFDKVNDFAENLKNNPNRLPYSWKLFSQNHCKTFARKAVKAGG